MYVDCLTDQVHCTQSAILCDRPSQGAEVVSPKNKLSDNMIDLSSSPFLSTITRDHNDLMGPISDNVCVMSNDISLLVDDALYVDPITAEGCCNASKK